MLPKNQRLNLRLKKNLKILRKARRVSSEFFTLYYFFNDKPTQATVTVSIKIDKLAVNRNKLKRQLYSILEIILEKQNIWLKNVKIILVTRKNLGSNFEKMKREVKKLFIKAKLA